MYNAIELLLLTRGAVIELGAGEGLWTKELFYDNFKRSELLEFNRIL